MYATHTCQQSFGSCQNRLFQAWNSPRTLHSLFIPKGETFYYDISVKMLKVSPLSVDTTKCADATLTPQTLNRNTENFSFQRCMILYHEYIVDHFTTTLSSDAREIFAFSTKTKFSHPRTSFYDRFPRDRKYINDDAVLWRDNYRYFFVRTLFAFYCLQSPTSTHYFPPPSAE